MSKLSKQYIGLRDKESHKIIAVYPEKINGTDKDIEKTVMDWHYKKDCNAEEDLSTSFVDLLTEDEIKSRNLK